MGAVFLYAYLAGTVFDNSVSIDYMQEKRIEYFRPLPNIWFLRNVFLLNSDDLASLDSKIEWNIMDIA